MTGLRVAIDAQQTIGTATGIGSYCNGLLSALPSAGVDVVALRDARIDPWRFDRRLVWDQVLLPAAASRSGAGILHCTSGSVPVASPLPVVVTVHDVAWLRGVQAHAPAYARWYFGPFSAGRWRAASAVIVDSHFTKSELLSSTLVDASRVSVIHPGVDSAFGAVQRVPSPQPLILCVGTVEKRKNVGVVIEALSRVPGARMICAGPPTPYQRECEELARRLGVADRIAFTGYLSRDELLELYAAATVAVAPSLYEGFGYAAAQALCAGVPLLAARSSSHVEVVADGGTLLDPSDAEAWTAALRRTLEASAVAEASAAMRRPDAVQRFSWSAAAAATAAIYRRVLSEPAKSGTIRVR